MTNTNTIRWSLKNPYYVTAEQIVQSPRGANIRHAQFAIQEWYPDQTVNCESEWRNGRQSCLVRRNTGICEINEYYRSWREAIVSECAWAIREVTQ